MKRLIITIHGIRWKADKDWQNLWGTYIVTQDSDIKVLHYRYGYIFGVWSWLINVGRFLKLPKFMRSKYVDNFRKFIIKTQEKFPDYEISVFAHSFGGWITEQALIKDFNDEIKLESIIFMHCPISSRIEKTNFWNWLTTEKIKRIYSWASLNDNVIGKIAIEPFGQNGYWNFIRIGHDEDRKNPQSKPYPLEIYNIRTEEDHGGVLDKIFQYGKVVYAQIIGNYPISESDGVQHQSDATSGIKW